MAETVVSDVRRVAMGAFQDYVHRMFGMKRFQRDFST
jgi:hypothetical protein